MYAFLRDSEGKFLVFDKRTCQQEKATIVRGHLKAGSLSAPGLSDTPGYRIIPRGMLSTRIVYNRSNGLPNRNTDW